MKYSIIIVVVVIFIALGFCVSARGQTASKVITNADLNKPLVWRAPPPSPEILAALARRQFVYVATSDADGPHFYIMGQRYLDQLPYHRRSVDVNMSGPWDWPRSSDRRLDGTSLWYPPTLYGDYSYPIYPSPYWRR